MGRIRLRGLGVGLVSIGLLLLGVALAPAASAKNQSDGYYMTLTDVSYDVDNDETTYTWTLNHDSREDSVSHLLIDTCLGGTAADTDPNAGYKDDEHVDNSTGATGYKWEGDPDIGDEFSITYPGNTGQAGSSTWTVKKGNGYVVGTTAGPSCGEQVAPTGSFVVSKAVEGPGPSDDYPFTVTCGPPQAEIDVADSVEAAVVAVPFTENIFLDHGESKTYEDLPAGWICSADETDNQGAYEVVIEDTTSPTTDGVVTIADGSTSRADFLNKFAEVAATGSLRVTKTVSGTSSETFPFTVSCTKDSNPVTLASGDASFTLAHGGSKTITGLPAGASCTVTETDNKNASSTAVVDSTAPTNDGIVTIAADTQSTADYTNTYVEATTTEVAGVVFSRTDTLAATGGSRTMQLVALALLLTVVGMSMIRLSRPEVARKR